MDREAIRNLLADLPANPIVDEIQDAFEAIIARAEAAERLAVWISKRVDRWDCDGFVYKTKDRPFSDRDTRFMPHDGTDANILRALKEASGID